MQSLRFDAKGMICRSPFEAAWDMIFQAPESAIRETLRSLFPDNGSYLDERRFSKLQKIILGLDGGSLENELKVYSSDIDAVDSTGNTALMWAARRDDNVALDILLRAGADPNIRSNSGISALIVASRIPDPRCVKLLLQVGADLTNVNDIGRNALHQAAYAHDGKEIIEALVAAGIDLDKADIHGTTSLSMAAHKSHAVSAETLLYLGANINCTDREGDTPLHESLFSNADDVTCLLIQRGAEFTTNIYRQTELHYAALSGGRRTLSILRAAPNLASLDPDARDKEGKTPLQIARDRETKPEGFVAEFQELLGGIRRQKAASGISFGAVNAGSNAALGPVDTIQDIFLDALETQPVGSAPRPATSLAHPRPSLRNLLLSCASSIKLLTALIFTEARWSSIQPSLAQSVLPRILLYWLFGLICAGLVYWVSGQMGREEGVRKGVSVIFLGGRDEV